MPRRRFADHDVSQDEWVRRALLPCPKQCKRVFVRGHWVAAVDARGRAIKILKAWKA